MKLKKFLSMVLGVCMAVVFYAVPAKALDMGVYLGTSTASYYNPDTGEIDDGGTKNAALGEGMCRSATGGKCLLEVDKDGNMWLTVRLLLQSNCKDIKLYTRTGNNTYSQVSYDIVSEDSSQDSVDYRFRVYSTDIQLKATMYVTPMGRDVLWYMTCGGFNLGSGDFVVSIDTTPPVSEPVPQTVKTEEKKAETVEKKENKKAEEQDENKNENKNEKKEETSIEENAEDPDEGKNDDKKIEEPVEESEEKDDSQDKNRIEKVDISEKSDGMRKSGMAVVVIVVAIVGILGIKRIKKGKK
ncbi:MAG: hypothetical protein IKI88_02760 [Anaerotignum sp.]|nr:hypothetical protein [Anaerotignum sp.]